MQLNSKKYIIGGGLTGLVWKHYHPEYQIISPEGPGGLYSKTHMVWLHDTQYTRKMLVDLGWSAPEKLMKKSYIGYCADSWIRDYQDEQTNKEIILRKMTAWTDTVDLSFEPTSKKLSLSSIEGENYMNTLNVDLVEMVNRLSTNSDILNAKVIKINQSTIVIEYKNGVRSELEYDSLITSMPAPVFWTMYDKPLEFKSVPITNVLVDKPPGPFDDSYEMVYYTPKQLYSRVSHLDKKYAVEITGEMSQSEFSFIYPKCEILEHFIIKGGRIWPNKDNISPQNNIIFSGRFGKWEYGITTEDVIEQAINTKL